MGGGGAVCANAAANARRRAAPGSGTILAGYTIAAAARTQRHLLAGLASLR